LLPALPVRKKMASSSASDRLSGPRWSSFSRGRSAAGQWRMDMDNLLVVDVQGLSIAIYA